MPGKKKGTQRVQCARCGQYFTEKQFETHKRVCRGDEPPALSGEEDDMSEAEFVEIDSDDEFRDYPQEVEPSRDYMRQQAAAMIEAHGLGLKGRRVGDDAKWQRVKRVKGRLPP